MVEFRPVTKLVLDFDNISEQEKREIIENWSFVEPEEQRSAMTKKLHAQKVNKDIYSKIKRVR